MALNQVAAIEIIGRLVRKARTAADPLLPWFRLVRLPSGSLDAAPGHRSLTGTPPASEDDVATVEVEIELMAERAPGGEDGG